MGAGYIDEAVVVVLVDDLGGCMPYAVVGGGIAICGGYSCGIEVGGAGRVVCCGGWYFSPAFGEGGIVFLLKEEGTAPGCGAGGPSGLFLVVGVG
jgi:hypothetical protein